MKVKAPSVPLNWIESAAKGTIAPGENKAFIAEFGIVTVIPLTRFTSKLPDPLETVTPIKDNENTANNKTNKNN